MQQRAAPLVYVLVQISVTQSSHAILSSSVVKYPSRGSSDRNPKTMNMQSSARQHRLVDLVLSPGSDPHAHLFCVPSKPDLDALAIAPLACLLRASRSLWVDGFQIGVTDRSYRS